YGMRRLTVAPPLAGWILGKSAGVGKPLGIGPRRSPQPFPPRMPAIRRGMHPAPRSYPLSATASEEIGMSPGAFWYHLRSDDRREQSGVAWALAAAILFVAIAAISFAVDQSVTLSSLPAPPPEAGAGR